LLKIPSTVPPKFDLIKNLTSIPSDNLFHLISHHILSLSPLAQCLMMDSSKEARDVTNVAASDQSDNEDHGKKPVPTSMKILSVVIVSMIGFGGHWSSGVTGALKSTLKKVR